MRHTRQAGPSPLAILFHDTRGTIVEKVVIVALVVTVLVAGVQYFGRSTQGALECQGGAIAQLGSDGVSRCVQGGSTTGAGAPLAFNSPPPSTSAAGSSACTGPACIDNGVPGIVTTGQGAPPATEDGCSDGVCTRPGHCFAAGTPVLTPEGPRAIDDLRPGDLVVSQDQGSRTRSFQRVVRTFVRPDAQLVALRVIGQDGSAETLHVTDEHPFWVPGRGWVTVNNLEQGATLVDARGLEATVLERAPEAAPATVYNLEVETTHSYFAGTLSLWVHNGCKTSDWPGQAAGTFTEAKVSDSGAYVVPELDENYDPVTGEAPLIYVATEAIVPPTVRPTGGDTITYGSTTYAPHEACMKYTSDCLHTTEEIINGNEPLPTGGTHSVVDPTNHVFGLGTKPNVTAAGKVEPPYKDDNANPTVGQGYAIVNPHWPDTDIALTSYHAEAVVAVDGPDRITHWVTAPVTEPGQFNDPGRTTHGRFDIYPTNPNAGPTPFPNAEPLTTFHSTHSAQPEDPTETPNYPPDATTIVLKPKPPKPQRPERPSGVIRPLRPRPSSHPYRKGDGGGASGAAGPSRIQLLQ